MIIFWLWIILMTLIAIGIIMIPFLKNFSRKRNIHTLSSFLLPPNREILITSTFVRIMLVCIGVTVIAIGLYLKLGASAQLAEQQKSIAQNKLLEAEIKRLGSLDQIISTLEKKVALNPDGYGWFLLGRLYLKTQKFNQARQAFAQANEFSPNQPDILVGYAESLYILNHFVLTRQAKQFLDNALQLQPTQADALNLLAMDAYHQKKYVVSIDYWEQLLKQPGLDAELQQKLLDSVARAQKEINQKENAAHMNLE